MAPADKKPSPPPSPPKKADLFSNVRKPDPKADFSNVNTPTPAPAKKADFSNVRSGHSTTAPTPPPAPAPPPQAARTYTVADGDSLWKIAKKELGAGTRWTELYDKNRAVIGDNPDRLKPGQVLTLPDSNESGDKR